MFALGTFSTVRDYIVSITAAYADIATGGTLYRALCGCSQPCEVPYHTAPPYHLPRVATIQVTISRSLEDLGCSPDIIVIVGMCSEAKVCRSVASQPTVITRQTFGFLWPTAAQRTHISATCDSASVPQTRQFAWKAWCSSNTWLQSLDRYQRLALAACNMHTTEPVSIIASRRWRRRGIGKSHLVTDGWME